MRLARHGTIRRMAPSTRRGAGLRDATMRRLAAIHRIDGLVAPARSEDEHRREQARNASGRGREHAVEPGVRALVEALNRVPGLETYASCGGHARPFVWQMPAGTFNVSFEIVRTARGFAALEHVAGVVLEVAPAAVLTAWAARRAGLPLAFELRGTRADGRAIARALSRPGRRGARSQRAVATAAFRA